MTDFMAEGMKKTGTEYYDDTNYMDLKLYSSLGANEDQIDRIRKIEGVTDAEGIVELNGKIGNASDMEAVVFMTATSRINQPQMIEGRLPENDLECAITEDLALRKELYVNDKVTASLFYRDEKVLRNDELTITGICHHPDYIRNNVTAVVLIDDSLIDQEVMHGLYTRVVVTQKGNEENTFSQEYYQKLDELKERLNEIVPELEKSSVVYVKDIFEQKVIQKEEEANQQIADAQEEIDKAREEAEKKLGSALKQINDGQKELDESYNTLVSAEERVEYEESRLRQAVAEYNANKKIIDGYGIDTVAEYKKMTADLKVLNALKKQMDRSEYQEAFSVSLRDTLIEKLDADIVVLHSYKDEKYENLFKDFDENGSELSGAYIDARILEIEQLKAYMKVHTKEGIVDGTDDKYRLLFNDVYSNNNDFIDMLEYLTAQLKEFNDAEKEIEKANQQIADAKWLISDGWIKYEDGKNKLAAARKEYANARKEAETQLTDAQNELDEKANEAKQEIAKARKEYENLSCNWLIADRKVETGYNDMTSNIAAEADSGKAFGLLFALVGGLVCFSTLVIIIEEEKKNVGTSKAFGFRNGEILGKYLVFGGTSALLGCLIGFFASIFGAKVVQKVIDQIGLYNCGLFDIIIDYRKVILVSVIVIIMSMAVSVLACLGLLRSPASILMKGQTVSGVKKRNSARSSSGKGSLYSRLILRNMLDDKARVLISIVIVAGSVFVIGTGICLRDSFKNMLSSQIEVVDHYDYRLDYGNATDTDQLKRMEDIFDRNGISYVSAYYKGLLYMKEDRLDGINLLVIDSDEAQGFINIEDPDTHLPLSMNDSGFYAQNRLAENMHLQDGDDLVIFDDVLDRYHITYSGQFNNYVGRLIIMSRNAYEKAFDEKVKDDCYYLKLNGASIDQLKTELSRISDDLSFYAPSSTVNKFKPVLSIYDIVVMIMLGFAIIMSFMILTNLANIYISRKKKELIVMRINGFSIAKTKHYLVIETIITTVTGLVLGVIAGYFLTGLIIRTMEQPDTQFIRSFNPKAWLIAIATEAFFALIIYTISFRKINKLNFREIT